MLVGLARATKQVEPAAADNCSEQKRREKLKIKKGKKRGRTIFSTVPNRVRPIPINQHIY